MSPDRASSLDVVELTAASGRWPRGTEGTVLEISDERGHTLEELELPLAMLRPLSPPAQEQLPVR